jgi:hypothetical protein
MKRPYIRLLAAVVLGFLATLLYGNESSVIELTTPHPPRLNETIELRVTAALPPGGRLRFMTEQSEFLGSVVPFGPRSGGRATTSTIPIPRSAMDDTRLRLRLEVVGANSPPRPPRPGEVESLDLILVPLTE